MSDVKRETWGRKLDFLLSCVGYAVGIGNLWRFPYLCMRNGGGAFLIPYMFFLVICAIPLLFLELSIGQFASLSPLTIWKICPLFKGLGWGMAALSWIYCTYSNILIAWALYFMSKSFTSSLPWASCDNSWNTDNCYTRGAGDNSTYNDRSQALNVTFSPAKEVNITGNVTALMEIVQNKRRTSAEEFWQYNVLELSSGVWDLGGMRWELFAFLAGSWVLVFLCLCKGVKSSGKVVYVTATMPYVFLTIILVRGLTLPGSMEGIRFYLTPDFEKLKHFKVWGEACVQIFYSLGAAWGATITMASYNKFHNNTMWDAIIIPLINSGTSFFAGFVIFSIIGFLAHEAELPVDDVITSGPGLAFIAYPEAIARMPLAPLWAVLFFLLLLFLGLDSQFATFETVSSGFIDAFPKVLRPHKTLFIAGMCFITFMLGIPLVSKAGMYMFHLLDWYVAVFSVCLIAVLECVAVAWIYGVERFSYDIKMMTGSEPNIYWKISWKFITPALLLMMAVFNCWQLEQPAYGAYDYPESAIVISWIISAVAIVVIPILAFHEILCKQEGTFFERLQKSLRPSDDWGPGDEEQRKLYKYSKLGNGSTPMLKYDSAPEYTDDKKVNEIDRMV